MSEQAQPVLAATHRQRERTARIAVISVVPTLSVTAYAALASNSLALFADLLLTILDAACVVAVWGVARRACLGRTRGLDFGLGKLESLIGATVGVVMIASMLIVTGLAVMRLVQGGGTLSGDGVVVGLVINGVYGLVNGWILLRYLRQRAGDPSPLVRSQIRLFVDKVTSNLLMVAALAGALLFSDTAAGPLIDPVASLLVAASMAFWSIQIIRSSTRDLIDAACGEEVRKPLMAALIRHGDAYRELCAIRTRRAGAAVYVELELGFAPHVSVIEIERLRVSLAAALRTDIPGLSMIVVPRPFTSRRGVMV